MRLRKPVRLPAALSTPWVLIAGITGQSAGDSPGRAPSIPAAAHGGRPTHRMPGPGAVSGGAVQPLQEAAGPGSKSLPAAKGPGMTRACANRLRRIHRHSRLVWELERCSEHPVGTVVDQWSGPFSPRAAKGIPENSRPARTARKLNARRSESPAGWPPGRVPAVRLPKRSGDEGAGRLGRHQKSDHGRETLRPPPLSPARPRNSFGQSLRGRVRPRASCGLRARSCQFQRLRSLCLGQYPSPYRPLVESGGPAGGPRIAVADALVSPNPPKG